MTVTGGKRLAAFLRQARKRSVRGVDVGFFADAVYDDGTPVTNVAAWHQFGTRHIPQRPFFTQAIAGTAARNELLEVLKANIGPDLVVTPAIARRMGLALQRRVQSSITTLRDPALAASTVLAKGSSNPLVDTGFLRASVSYKLVA